MASEDSHTTVGIEFVNEAELDSEVWAFPAD
jgi:hypothetical protein